MNSGTSKVSVEFKGWAHALTFLLHGVPWSRVWYQQQLGKFLTSHPYPVQQRHYKGHFNLKRVILIKNIIDLLCWWRNSVLFEWCLKLSMSWWPGMCGCGGGLGFTWCHLLQIPQSRNLPQSVTNVFQHLGWLFQNVITLDGVHLMQVELSSCAVCSQVSCGQPEQEEQLSPLKLPWGGLGCQPGKSIDCSPRVLGERSPAWRGVLRRVIFTRMASQCSVCCWTTVAQSNVEFHCSSGKIPPWEQKLKHRERILNCNGHSLWF